MQATFTFSIGQIVEFHLGTTPIMGRIEMCAIDDAGEIYHIAWADQDGCERFMWLRSSRLNVGSENE